MDVPEAVNLLEFFPIIRIAATECERNMAVNDPFRVSLKVYVCTGRPYGNKDDNERLCKCIQTQFR